MSILLKKYRLLGSYLLFLSSLFFISSSILAQTQLDTLFGDKADDLFGFDVALSANGQIFAAGAKTTSADAPEIGYVKVFQQQNDGWQQLGQKITGNSAGDWFGDAIDLSGDGKRVAVGAPFNDTAAEDAGQVRIFEWNGTSWIQIGQSINGDEIEDWLGTKVSLSYTGDVLAISITGFYEDRVKIYQLINNTWTQLGATLFGETSNDFFGADISLASDGTKLAVGAGQGNNYTGQAKVYQWTGTTWNQLGNAINGNEEGDDFGWSIALSPDGQYLIAGAIDQSRNGEGYAKVFKYETANWQQIGADIFGQDKEDGYGSSVAITADGQTVAISATGKFQVPGHVEKHHWNGTNWVLEGDALHGQNRSDFYGNAIAMSTDGQILGIGAYGFDNRKGLAQIVQFTSTTTCPIDEVLNTNPDENATIYASNSIHSSTIINAGLSITYQAGQIITLSTGFHAKNGAIFQASIGDCPIMIQPNSASAKLRSVQSYHSGELLSRYPKSFPNPAHQALHIPYLNKVNSTIGTFQLFNMQGQLLTTHQLLLQENGLHTINVSDYHTGLYFYTITSAGQQIVEGKFIKE